VSTDESDERVDELIETLPSYIGYHRAAGWIPDRAEVITEMNVLYLMFAGSWIMSLIYFWGGCDG
jgi:hypothetical protein